MKKWLSLAAWLIATSLFGNFAVSPLSIEFHALPETDQTKTLYIENKGSEPVNLGIYPRDYLLQEEGLEKELPPGTIQQSCAKWVSLSEKGYIHLPPHSGKEVQVSIQVPKGAQGFYWSKLFLEEEIPAPEEESTGKKILVRQRWEIRIFEKVPNTTALSAEISQLKILPPEESNPLSVEVSLLNSGNTLVNCLGEVAIEDQAGLLVTSYPLAYEETFSCYPHSKRLFRVPLTEVLPNGTYKAIAIIYLDNGKSLTRETAFKIPRKLVANHTSLLKKVFYQ